MAQTTGVPPEGPSGDRLAPAITEENLDQYVHTNMPPQHYALCGCEGMPEYPQRLGGEP